MNSETLTRTLEAPSFAFDPKDPWTETFQEALRRARLAGQHIYEVGLGTGTNAIFLLRACEVASVSGSDIDPRLTELAIRNLRKHVPDEASRFHPVKGAVSLIDSDAAQAAVSECDVVIACLPQVGCPGDTRLSKVYSKCALIEMGGTCSEPEDHLAHYYPWSTFDEFPFNAVGFGLNEALLKRLRVGAPRAEIIINLGCRVGRNTITCLFEANGYRPECLFSQIVRQHQDTDISFFVALEGMLKGTDFEHDFVCEFFSDSAGKVPLSALQAHEIQKTKPWAPLYHEVSTFIGRPLALETPMRHAPDHERVRAELPETPGRKLL